MYALLTRLLKPLPSDVSCTMRQLYRICCRFRFILVNDFLEKKNYCELLSGNKSGPLDKKTQQMENDNLGGQTYNNVPSEDEFEKKLAVLNTIIVITGLYFGQGEQFAQLSEK